MADAHGEAMAALDALEQEQRERVKAQADELCELMVEAFASGEDEKAAKLQARRAKAEQAAAGPWAERIAGAERAATRAQAERDGFIAMNYAGLVRERAPGAHGAARRLEDALRELIEARQAWQSEAREQVELTRAVGNLDGRSIAELGPLDELVRRARPLIGSVPAPLPREQVYVTIAPHDAPDRERRQAARDRIAREAAQTQDAHKNATA